MGRLKREAAKVIRSKRRREAFQVEVPHPSHIQSALERVLAQRIRHVIAELHRLRLRNTRLVPADRREPRTGAEVERRKRIGRRMLADIHSLQIELLQSARARDRETDARRHIRKAEPELVQQLRRNRVRVRHQQAAVVNAVAIVRQQRIRIGRCNVLSAEPRIR